jgi:PAS domain S-box-containing protein
MVDETVSADPHDRQTPDFRALFESAPGLYLVLTPNLKIVAVSDAYLRATMTERDKIVGRNLFDVFPNNADDPTGTGTRNLRSSLERVCETKTDDVVAAQKYDIRRPDSEGGGFEVRYCNLVNSPVCDPNGELAYIIQCVEDATAFIKLKQHEDEQARRVELLNERSEKMSVEIFELAKQLWDDARRLHSLNDKLAEQAALLDAAYDPALVWNLDDGEITFCNSAAEQLYGLVHRKAIGRPIHEVLGASGGAPDMQSALRKTGCWKGTITLKTKDDRQIVVDSRMLAFQANDGVTRILESDRDVTEQKRAEQALRARERRFRQLAEATPVMIWQVTPEGSVNYVNQRLRDYVGSETMTLADWVEAVHPEDRPRVASFRKSARTARRLCVDEFRVRRYDGNYRWFYVQWAPVLNSDGTPACWIGAATDIDALKRAKQAVVETNQRKDEFLATLAHELRNPLAPIRFALDGLKTGVLPPSHSEHARDIIERQVTQLVRLVEDLLDASRITTNKIRLRREPVPLADLMRTAVEGAAPLAHAAEHRLAVELPPSTLWIDADPARLVQVFMNVLNNAVKFTPRGGRISFTAAGHDHEAIVRICDTGVGIAPDALPHLFEMFHQEGRILERSTGGLGIGLTLARRLIEMHDGTIEVRSEGVGKGTDVEIRLPTTATRRTLTGQGEFAIGDGPGRSLRVEIVDDNADAAEMLDLLVSGLGHTTKLAHDGLSALQLAESFAPDVILLDIGLPIMNGYDVAREVRRRPALRNVHLAAMTGWGQAEDRHRAREAGFDTHFTKPASVSALQELLAAVGRNGAFASGASGRPRTRFGDTATL